jgi:hypothetical protein
MSNDDARWLSLWLTRTLIDIDGGKKLHIAIGLATEKKQETSIIEKNSVQI